MKNILLLTLIPCLASCVAYEHVAQSKTGNYERDRMFSLGGQNAHRGADGSSLTTDHVASFQHATQAITALAASAALNSIGKAQEVTKQQASASAAKSADLKTTTDAATAQAALDAKTSVTNKALENPAVVPTVNPITPP